MNPTSEWYLNHLQFLSVFGSEIMIQNQGGYKGYSESRFGSNQALTANFDPKNSL